MNKLTLDTFLYVDDFELSQYKILDCLKSYSSDFRKNRIYPALADLSELNIIFKEIEKDDASLGDLFIQQFYKKSLADDNLLVEPVEISNGEFESVLELIEWFRPFMKETMEEGKALYDFVKKNLQLEQIGAVKNDNEKGFILIPDNEDNLLQVLSFEVVAAKYGTRTTRKLNTYLIDSVPLDFVNETPEDAILSLFEKYPQMPDSTTFIFKTDLDFSFADTILPVAKRKLMARLAA